MGVRYLLDTNAVSELMKDPPSAAMLSRMRITAPDDRVTSSVTAGELLFGAHRAGVRSDELLERARRIVSENLPVLPFGEEAAEEYGRLRAYLEAQGTPIGHPDTQIAAIALANDLTVVTGNVRHFQRVPGLAVENWLE